MIFAFMIATELLDLEMTPLEKKKTGLHKLSGKEKSALQSWLDTNYVKREEPLLVAIPEKKPTVLRTQLHGNEVFVFHSDGTSWQISAKDRSIALGWVNPDVEIIVHRENEMTTLTNTLSGTTIQAKNGTPIH